VILVLPFAVLPLMTTSDALLWAFGRLRFLAVVGVLATIVNIGLDILLIPAYDAVGAALANIGAQLFAGVPSLVLAARLTGPVTISVRAVAGTALAAAAGGGLAWAPTELIGGVAGVAVGLVAGTAAMWVVATRVGILAADDARWAAALFGERLGGVPAAVCRRVGMRERPVSGT
jgi:O-antigen/teichoic acid export membrane protein